MTTEEKLSVNQISAIIESQQQRVDDSKKKKTVCVHWLNGQCKKGDNCEYLHVYQEDKIPPCKYFLQEGQCQKGDKCVYRHISSTTEKKIEEDCPYYERGFCRLNQFVCGLFHNPKKICENYMYGFCPLGPECDKVHAKSIIADNESSLKKLANFPDEENWQDKTSIQPNPVMMYQKAMMRIRCHRCGEIGHKSTYCQEEPIHQEQLNKILEQDDYYNMQNSNVLCFKCKKYGHYANVCPMKNQNQNTNMEALGGMPAAGFQQFNKLVQIQQQINPGGDIFNQNQAAAANQSTTAGSLAANDPQYDANMAQNGYGISNQDGVNGGGQQNELAQSLQNIKKLLDKDNTNNNTTSILKNTNMDQIQTVTRVSLNDLPLSLTQINQALGMLVQSFQYGV